MSENEKKHTHDDDVVVEPRSSKLDPKVHDPVIFCPVGVMVELTARIYNGKKAIRRVEPAKVYTIRHQGKKMSLVGPAMGAPASVYVLERLIASGVKNIIMIGLCGSIDKGLKIGDVFVPSAALIEEGTSPHYNDNKTKKAAPSERALLAACDALQSSGKGYHTGPVWTIDGIFRETKKKVLNYNQRGLLAVEMEASALFTVAEYRGIDLASILVVSDELFDLRWKTGFTRPKFISACRHVAKIALTAAANLAPDEDELEDVSGSENKIEEEKESGDEHETEEEIQDE